MRLSNDKTKYTSSWKYVELARFIPSLNRVIREKINDQPVMIDIDSVSKYRNKYNNTGLYTSVWQYNSTDIADATRLGSLYFDIDNKVIDISYQECKKLQSYLSQYIPEQSMLVYYTGKKGFHIELEALALGINPSNSLHSIFRYIAADLSNKLDMESLDFSVYDQRRMWRLAGSKHQETGLYKTLLPNEVLYSGIEEIIKYSSEEQSLEVPEQEFSYVANEWYRNYTYQMDEEKNKPKDILSHFNEYGSKALKVVDESDRVFDKDRLLANCSSIKEIVKTAEEKKHLDHESRLFLCSILTYTNDSIQFLHSILSKCSDYNYEKSSAHINDWIRRREMGIGGRPFTCERANSVGVGCGDCHLEKRNKWIKVGEKYLETQEKSSPSPIRFAYHKERKGGES